MRIKALRLFSFGFENSCDAIKFSNPKLKSRESFYPHQEKGGGHWGVLETAKPKKKSSKTAKPPKNSPKTRNRIQNHQSQYSDHK